METESNDWEEELLIDSDSDRPTEGILVCFAGIFLLGLFTGLFLGWFFAFA